MKNSSQIQLRQIQKELADNQQFFDLPACREILDATIDFYKRVGFLSPWVGYFASLSDHIVGAAGFKGKPVNGTVEIAYGTFEPYQKQGVATSICRELVELALRTDPSIRITARTLPDGDFSIQILKKNGFVLLGTIEDPDDGQVCEWEYGKPNASL